MSARRSGERLVAPAEPTIAQRLAEELVTDLVRRHVDVIGLIELEREVGGAVGGIAHELGAGRDTVPAAALAAHLLDLAWTKVEAEWREQRRLADSDECLCCAAEAAELRRSGRAGEGGLS